MALPQVSAGATGHLDHHNTIHKLFSQEQGIRYVSTLGNDSDDGLAWASAKLTVSAAVDALPDGGTVVIGPGTFMTSGVTIDASDTTLIGAGMDATILKSNAGGINALRIDNGATGLTNVVIQDLTCHGNRTGFAGSGVACYGAGNVTDLKLIRCRFTNGQAFSLFLDTVQGGYDRLLVDACVIEDSGGGWDTFGSGQLENSVIRNNWIGNSTGQGFAVTGGGPNLIVEGNIITACGTGISLEPATQSIVRDNVIYDLLNGSVGIWPRCSDAGSDSGELTIEGNRIYNSSVAGADNSTDYGIILENTSDSIVRGNRIHRMGWRGMLIRTTNITNSAKTTSRNLVEGNMVTDNDQQQQGADAILVDQATSGVGTIDGNTFRNNDCRRIDTTNSGQGWGIRTTGTVTNTTITDNDVRGNATAGVAVSGTSDWIENNRGYNPQGAASLAPGASPWTYTNSDNVREIIYIRGGTVSSITKNSRQLYGATNCSVELLPGDAMTVTYSSAPTAEKDRR